MLIAQLFNLNQHEVRQYRVEGLQAKLHLRYICTKLKQALAHSLYFLYDMHTVLNRHSKLRSN